MIIAIVVLVIVAIAILYSIMPKRKREEYEINFDGIFMGLFK